jgi:mono/diheme cytochrome c family protein
MIYKSLMFRLLLLFSFSFLTINSTFADQVIDQGKALFKANCKQCHNANMKDKMTGPALGGVRDRWESEELLYSWIRNSTVLALSGDSPYATQIYNEWKKSPMNPFPNLKDEEITAILAYIDCKFNGDPACSPKAPISAQTTGGTTQESDNTFLFITLFIILALLAVVLARIISNLNHMAEVKEGNTDAARRSLVDILTGKGVIGFVIFTLIVLGGYTTVNKAIDLGRQQGYSPDQPIKFSHVTHAGLHKIDCQYCHDGARRSKHSVIPATNTCMNCHVAVKKGSTYGTAEITKIYASAGFNPITGQYIENYNEMAEEDIELLFKEWIADNYLDDNELTALGKEGMREVESQWKGIKESLTNETKPQIQGPIEWVKIHNLPDHVYFNHSQHVSIGKVACQTCHGPVEKMKVVEQYAPLSMGWCVNCHRQTEIKFSENNYYQSYERYHKEMKEGKRDKVTVEEIGGLECQKCHY